MSLVQMSEETKVKHFVHDVSSEIYENFEPVLLLKPTLHLAMVRQCLKNG
jgi:hypothetical protein